MWRTRFAKFWLRRRVLFWKAILMRKHTLIVTFFELVVPIVFSLQIRLIFEPLALNSQPVEGNQCMFLVKNDDAPAKRSILPEVDLRPPAFDSARKNTSDRDLNQYTKENIMANFPKEVQCRYTPKNKFVDNLMSKASELLRTKISPAKDEEELVSTYDFESKSVKALWAIFKLQNDEIQDPKILKYKIRSSEIGKDRIIAFNDDEPTDDDPYVSSGFIALQMAIEHSFVQMRRSKDQPTLGDDLSIGRFPFYKINFPIVSSVFRPNLSVIYYMMIVAFLLLPMATLQKVIHDKETGFRELMRMMNMNFGLLYVGWIDYMLIVAIPVAIVCTILLYPIYSNTNPVVLVIFVIAYITMSTCFMFAIGTFFNNSMKALMASLIFWLFLSLFTMILDQSLANSTYSTRILSLVLPHSGLLYGLVTFTSRNDVDTFQESRSSRSILSRTLTNKSNENFLTLINLRNYHDIYNILSEKDNIAIGVIIASWLLHIVIWCLLTLYLDNINPGIFGSAKPWYYLCRKGTSRQRDIDLTYSYKGSTNWSAVEQLPQYLTPSIRLRKITKKFDHVLALDDMSIDFYRDEFNVILGHNGAGKSSLLKIIIGMFKPTGGNVYIEGRDYNLDRRSFTNLIGYCPQENILVNYLTVLQHIYMFGMMKGMTYKAALAEALFLLKQLDLESMKDSKVTKFSSGVQRRVCLAMALIGKAKILILDEPTYGIDLEHRRQVWDLLSANKKGKTIIMSTNSMEAADILADRIAIIANYRIECCGSKMYLNRRYGIGYVLSTVLQENCDLNVLLSVMQKYSSAPVTLRSTMGLVARFDLPRSTRFSKLLQYLEYNKEVLAITSLALSAASIEGQFLRIGLASQLKQRHVYHPQNKYESIAQRRRRDLIRSERTWKRMSGSALWRQQVLTMFHKKCLHVISSWKLYTFCIFFSIVAFILTMMMTTLSSLSIFRTTEVELNVTKYTHNNFRLLYYATNDKVSNEFLAVLSTIGQSYDRTTNFHVSKNIAASDLMIHPNLNTIEFRDRYFVSIDILKQDRVDLMYSSTAVHSGPIAVNLFYNALLSYYSGSEDYRIKLSSQPIVNPKQWQHRIVQPRSVKNWENEAIVATLCLLLPSIDLVTKESKTRSKQLQLNTAGMSTITYWIPIYMMDLFLYSFSLMIISFTCYIAYHGSTCISIVEILQVLMILVCYGAAAIPMNYFVQLFVQQTGNMYICITTINLVILLMVNGSVTLPLITRLFDDAEMFFSEMLFHAFPPYVLACAISNYFTLNLYNRHCTVYNTCGTKLGREDPCCQNCDSANCYKPLSIMFVKQSGANYYHSIANDILTLLSQTFSFLLLLEIFEQKNRNKWYRLLTKTTHSSIETEEFEGPDIIAERNKVEQLMKDYEQKGSLSPDIALIVQNLRKNYKKMSAVCDINFSINRQECFGLLGINGAGKSTIYKMLTGQTRVTGGKAAIRKYELTSDKDEFVGTMGYCPQHGGLNEFMTGRQNLQLHAALRGIPFRNISDEVDKWLDIFDLLDFENQKIKNCPLGVQRKICVLQSLIGDLPIILLDEPSSGIDVMARHALCDTLHQLREMGRSLLVTTHSMEEAEALCIRVGILVGGQFVAIGSCEQLKEQHGNNFTMYLRLQPDVKSEIVEAIKSDIDEAFPDIQFKDRHLSTLKYELSSNILYSNVFDKLEKIRTRHPSITDYSINQPTMEQVFLTVAKKRQEEFQFKRKSCCACLYG